MKTALRAGRMGVWRRLLVVGVTSAVGCLWLGSAEMGWVIAQGGAPSAAAGGQTGATAPSALGTVRVVSADVPPAMILDRGAAKQLKLTLKNTSGGELTIASIAVSPAPDAPQESRKIEVSGWQPRKLGKDGTTEITLSFPPHSQEGEYALALSLTTPERPNEASAPFYFLTVKVEEGTYLVGRWGSFAIAIGFLLVVLLLTVLVKSEGGINFFQSPDGSVSVSKVQVWMWTMAIIFSYVYLFLWQGPPGTFPDSLWELMGISALSTGTAKYISVVTGKAQQPATPAVQQKIAKQNWLVSMLSDDGEPSMMRLQMFGWTLVTVFLFLMYLHKNRTLWNVPQALVILMGISHAGYLADKGAAASKPT